MPQFRKPLLLGPSRPSWNLTGRWQLGPSGASIRLRHWPRLANSVWSTSEYKGAEELVGRVEKDGMDWVVKVRFGSTTLLQGTVTAKNAGLKIEWENGTTWVKIASEPQLPRRSLSGALSIWKCLSALTRTQKLKWLIIMFLVAVCLTMLLDVTLYHMSTVIEVISTFFSNFVLPLAAFLMWTFCGLLFLTGVTACLMALGILTCDCFGGGTCLYGLIAAASAFALACAIPAAVLLSYLEWTNSKNACMIGCIVFFLPVVGMLAGAFSMHFYSIKNCCAQMTARNPIRGLEFITQLSSEDPDFKLVEDSFKQNCARFSQMYPFNLEVVSVYSVTNHSLKQKYIDTKTRLQSKTAGRHSSGSGCHPVMHLYHGTSKQAAAAIITGGFKLPTIAGMFGKGVYFADTPLKSWQYSTKTGSQFLLVCEVALGNQMPLRHARTKFNPQRDFQRSWFKSVFGAREYDSIVALSKAQGGAVNVPEYVIFHPWQALPAYVIEARERASVASL